ncbi:MAG TPA: NUDIX domain-containing protein [Anaerolineales bacterium]
MKSEGTTQVYPEPIVGALVFNAEGKLLLVKSHKWRDLYGLPGGHIELQETMKDAIRREVKEETSLDVDQIEFLCFQEVVFDEAFWTRSHFIFFDFVCKSDSTDVTLNSEAEEHVWIPPQEAMELPIDSYTKKAIVTYLERVDANLGEVA